MMASAGVDRVLTWTCTPSRFRFLRIPGTTLYSGPISSATCGSRVSGSRGRPHESAGVARAGVAKRLEADLAIIDKRLRNRMSRRENIGRRGGATA